jgi:KaiC/GvpD/RAD55 family RecA-like ATPase
MVEVHSGIKVIDDAIKEVSKKRCSVLVMGRKAAETFIFQLASSLCENHKSQTDNSKKIRTIYVNFNDSDENFLEKAERVGWGSEEEKLKGEKKEPKDLIDIYIDLYDRRSVGGIDSIVKKISDEVRESSDEVIESSDEVRESSDEVRESSDEVRESSDDALESKNKLKEESKGQIVIILNSLSRLALYLGEDRVLDFLSTMNYLETDADISLLVFFTLDDSLHESLFVNRVKSLVDNAIIFKEDNEMEITENFFGLEGFGESTVVAKWYPCLDIEEYGIVPIDFLEVSKSYEKDKDLKERIKLAEARIIMKFSKKEGYLDSNLEKNFKNIIKDEKEPVEWLDSKQKEYRNKHEKTFRTGIWAIDRVFSEKNNILGGMEHYYGIAVYYEIPPLDMHPVFAKILSQCFEDKKPFIEISIDDTPNVFLDSLKFSHKMKLEHEKIKKELIKGSKFRFINSYGIEPSKELGKGGNIINIDNPYNVTIMFAKYREARKSLHKKLDPKEDETGPVIWLNSYTGLTSVTSFENAYSFGVSTIMAQDVWSPKDKWKSFMLFSMQKGFLSEKDDENMLQVLDGIIRFSSRRILGNRMYYFCAPKMPKTNKTVGWTPYRITERLGFLPLDEKTVYHYLEAGVLVIKGRKSNG